MKQKFLIFSLLILTLSSFYFIYSEITKNSNRDYEETSYENIKQKNSMGEEFLLFIKKDGCIYCENVALIVEELSRSSDLQVWSIKSNREKESALMLDELNVNLYPTVIYFKNGKEVSRILGEFDEKELYNLIGGISFGEKEE